MNQLNGQSSSVLSDRIVGFCQFSVSNSHTLHPYQGAFVDDRSASCPADHHYILNEGLKRKFSAFERLLIPSIRAQTDTDFELWVLLSPDLPEPLCSRMYEICEDIPQVQLLVWPEKLIGEVLRPILEQVAQESGRPALQFRIDDDSAISRHFIARLRYNARRFSDFRTLGLSQAAGLAICGYPNEPLSYWRCSTSFISTGAAARMGRPWRHILAMPSAEIPRVFTSFSDTSHLGYVKLQWDPMVQSHGVVRPKLHKRDRLEPSAFNKLLAEDFPFLLDTDFSFINGALTAGNSGDHIKPG